jgi:hypothetical protein
MSDRSAWWRTGAGVAAWLALAVAASGAAWAAVGVVGDESQPSSITVPTTRGEDSPPPTEPSSTGSTSTPTPAPDEGTRRSETLASAGGRVTVACTGPESIRMTAALPSAGWTMQPEEKGPDEVEVEFTNGDSELRIRARCKDGVIEPDVDTDD